MQSNTQGPEESAHPEPSLPNQQTPFRPHPVVDWRFLPEPALLVKDTIRHHFRQAVLAASKIKLVRPVSAKAWQARMLQPSLRAGRLFIHIPRTGGTSISSCFYQRNQPHLTAEFVFYLYGDLARSVPSFSALRNPLHRLQSSYHYLRNGGTSLMAASRYEMKQLDSTSFADFVDVISHNPDLVRDLLIISTQSSFVCDQNGHVIVDRLFRMGSAGGSPRLLEWLGISQMPRLNVAQGSTPSISAATRRKVELLYAADYDLFEAPSTDR